MLHVVDQADAEGFRGELLHIGQRESLDLGIGIFSEVADHALGDTGGVVNVEEPGNDSQKAQADQNCGVPDDSLLLVSQQFILHLLEQAGLVEGGKS